MCSKNVCIRCSNFYYIRSTKVNKAKLILQTVNYLRNSAGKFGRKDQNHCDNNAFCTVRSFYCRILYTRFKDTDPFSVGSNVCYQLTIAEPCNISGPSFITRSRQSIFHDVSVPSRVRFFILLQRQPTRSSSRDETVNVNFFTTTSYTHYKITTFTVQ